MSEKSTPDYKSLYLQAEQRREEAERQQRQAEARQRQAENECRQEKERREEGEQRTRSTMFEEYLRYCHNLSRPLSVATLSRLTTGQIPSPTGKYCPI